MGDVIFDNRRFSDFGVIVSGENTWNQPTRRVTKMHIPGHSGDLIVESGEFENVDISYPAGIMHDFDSYNDGWEAFAQFLARRSDAYYRLEDEYHPLYYRMARFVPGIAPKVGTLNRSGQFTVTFDCKPQKFLKSGDTEIVITDYTNDDVVEIINNTQYVAYPEIQISPWVKLSLETFRDISEHSDPSFSYINDAIIVKPTTEDEEEINVTYTYDQESGEVVKRYRIQDLLTRDYLKSYATSYSEIPNNCMRLMPHSITWARVEQVYDANNQPIVRDDINIRIKPRFYTI